MLANTAKGQLSVYDYQAQQALTYQAQEGGIEQPALSILLLYKTTGYKVYCGQFIPSFIPRQGTVRKTKIHL
jgi:hypothetical protein